MIDARKLTSQRVIKKPSLHEIGKGFLYVLIPLLPIILFWIVPMVISIYLSFTDWDYISPTINIVKMENYTEMLSSAEFMQALKNTLFFGVGTVVPTLVIGFGLAMLLKDDIAGKSIFRGFLFSPWITPMVAMSIVWSWMFRGDGGLINQTLAIFGIGSVNWLTDSKVAMWAVIIVTIWKNAGWAMLFYIDALSKIPKDYFEVAKLEGGNTFQVIWNILLPFSLPTTYFLLVVSLIDSIQAYDQINVLTQGGPSGSTRTLLYLFYQMAFEQFNIGKATAVAVIIVIITMLLSLVMKRIFRRVS